MAEPITALAAVGMATGLKALFVTKGITVGVPGIGSIMSAYATGGTSAAISAGYHISGACGAAVAAFFGR